VTQINLLFTKVDTVIVRAIAPQAFTLLTLLETTARAEYCGHFTPTFSYWPE
jgi:hypothetical protein